MMKMGGEVQQRVRKPGFAEEVVEEEEEKGEEEEKEEEEVAQEEKGKEWKQWSEQEDTLRLGVMNKMAEKKLWN